MGKTYSNAFRFASVNADMVAGGLVLVAVLRIEVKFGVHRNAVYLFHQLQVITCTCGTSKIIDGELYHMFAMRKYEQEKTQVGSERRGSTPSR